MRRRGQLAVAFYELKQKISALEMTLDIRSARISVLEMIVADLQKLRRGW